MTKICYFSATGNSLWSAKKIAERLGGECEFINIGVEAQKDEINLEADVVLLFFPAYAYGPPLIVKNFLRRTIIKTPYFAAFVSYGTSPGGALAAVSSIVHRTEGRRKEIKSFYFGRIPSVENYIAIFGPQKPKTIERRLELQRKATDEAAGNVLARKTNSINTFRPLSAFVFVLFSLGAKIFYKWYQISDKCDGCGICEKFCPVSAITIKDRRPHFSGKCEHCQGCLNWCPQRAIQFGRFKFHIPGYHHPEIGLADMTRNANA